MELEDQVCSLELSKRLKELGVKQKSLFYWSENAAYGWQIVNNKYPKEDLEENGMTDGISAFSVAELGEMIGIHLGQFRPQYGDETEADYRAEALISLIENKFMDCNERGGIDDSEKNRKN